MKYTIIHDCPDPMGQDILRYMQDSFKGIEGLQFIDLQSHPMEPCTGCFNCWLKTPGLCIFHDAAADIVKEIVNSDRVLFLNPLTWGAYSPQLKILLDRSLCRVLPFFETHKGETHHPSRYEKSPIPFLAGYGADLDQDEMELFKSTGQNLNDNLHKTGMETVIIRNRDDFHLLDSFAGTKSMGGAA
ncbi:MAG: NAD(P)H-dependent oxidoreductase [Spirochaetales bacterium]|nr:NAD(P)H-dependent oxidoreductase [Spirochaetales bacterium]